MDLLSGPIRVVVGLEQSHIPRCRRGLEVRWVSRNGQLDVDGVLKSVHGCDGKTGWGGKHLAPPMGGFENSSHH